MCVSDFLLNFFINSKLDLFQPTVSMLNEPAILASPRQLAECEARIRELRAQLRITVNVHGVVWMLKMWWVFRGAAGEILWYVVFAVEPLQYY